MYENKMRFGPKIRGDGNVQFDLWAPAAQTVELVFPGGIKPMKAVDKGWYSLKAPGIHGTLYKFRIDGSLEVPDPASRWQPSGAHGPSMVVDSSRYRWRTKAWTGRPWHEALLYELHIGTFTPEGTFLSAIERLPYLADLGITALEVMPVAQFAGHHNWGYDCVKLFAPQNSYGTPYDFMAFIDACHKHRIQVLLDVVYNHLGPEGNYLGTYCRDFFRKKPTGWGEAINFTEPWVRWFYVENARYWLDAFRLDGLRVDAVHAMVDDSPTHIVEEIVQAVQAGPGRSRHVHIILENHGNQASFLNPGVAQWDDDSRHSAVLAAGRDATKLAPWNNDYMDPGSPGGGPLGNLAIGLTKGLVYQGETSPHSGHARGEPAGNIRQTAFLLGPENHDWIGNGPKGERLIQSMSPEQLRLLYTVMLLSPKIPVIFMGGEWCTRRPFMYFVDHTDPAVMKATREGRIAEFRASPQFAEAAERGEIPDPGALSTFLGSKLDWNERQEQEHALWQRFVKNLIILRQWYLWPLLKGETATGNDARVVLLEGNILVVEWTFPTGRWTMAANFGPSEEGAEGLKTLGGTMILAPLLVLKHDRNEEAPSGLKRALVLAPTPSTVSQELARGKLPPLCAVFFLRKP